MRWLNVAGTVSCTEVEGPGRRFALWVQGCRMQCPGCCNPEMFALEPCSVVNVAQVIAQIESSRRDYDIEGVTFLGGEPLLQAQSLAEVAAACRERELTVMVFTGYTLEQIHRDPLPGALDLVANTDVLVDGPFVANFAESGRNWVGSRNQRFHFLTARYKPGIEYDSRWSNGVEFAVDLSGVIVRSGWPGAVKGG